VSKVVSLSRDASAEHTGDIHPESTLLRSIVMATPASVDLDPEPIPQEWILSGTPVARSKNLVRSRDWTSSVVVWDCTAGRFTWHYSQDETILVISGEAFLLLENGEERRFGPGEVGFFPSGTTCTWRVADYIRKVAVLRESMWRPLGFCLKAWKKLLRVMGLAGKSPL
jgi:uncharacterized cupin superfamily protein